ncbi:MAG: VCBS repeat-containing protein [Saprospiraceae bacterium]|nr:VCBS repeat-containing protein [Saprospiraceae bacterium]
MTSTTIASPADGGTGALLRGISMLRFFALPALLSLAQSCTQSPTAGEASLFQTMSARETGVSFRNDLTETADFNIIQYLYFYNGGGVAAGDVNNDGLVDLYFTSNQGPNRLYLNRGDFRFEDVTESAGVAGAGDWKTGVAMADVNGDGRLDIYVCQVGQYKHIRGQNQLFINNGDGTFTERAAEYGLDFAGFSTQAAFFDYDGDGDLDLYLLNHSVHAAENYGPATIRDRRDALAGDRLYRNDNGRFTDVSEQAGIYGSRIGYGLGVGISDLNGDGLPDIYVSNDFHENDYLYYNNGDGTFREALAESMSYAGNFSMGSDLADFNNDGLIDVITLDMKPEEEFVMKQSAGADPYNIFQFKLSYGYHYQFPRNMLQLNRGLCGDGQAARFSEIGQLAGVAATDWSWAALFFDMDNDGWKDIFISNGIWRRLNDLDYLNFISNEQIQRNASDLEMAARMPSGAMPNYAYRNNADLTFSNVSAAFGLNWSGSSNGAAYADLDNDGDLDLVVNNLNAEATLFRNQAAGRSGNGHLTLQLEGEGLNRFGIGAKVVIACAGQMQVQEHFSTRGFQSSVAPGLHFGLGKAQAIDSLLVVWPDGQLQVLRDVPAGQKLTLRQQDALATDRLPNWFEKLKTPLRLVEQKDRLGLDFVHVEDEPSDFDREKLMPLMASTPGPRLARGDANGDGLEDLFVCGARGQAGALYLQTPGGAFRRKAIPALEQDSLYEDAAACFFDADGDGRPDLYIVSGGAVEPSDDRLYLNDGKGGFRRAAQALPGIHAQGSCVVPFDFDGDGDFDLFVGSYAVPHQYGIAPRSYLFRNDGGIFTDVTAEVAPELAEAGMVTAAAWDAGQQTLVVVGHWMPITLLVFKNEKALRSELPDTEGWWSAVALFDADGDGDMDMVAGNWGLNSEFQPTVTEPLYLYAADFDGNGSTDPVMAWYKQGKLYSFHGRDELARQMVSIKKQYTDYRGFARAAFHDIFPENLLSKAVPRKAVTFASMYLENTGNGRYAAQPLPTAAQLAPVYAVAVSDFDADGRPDVLLAGNFYETQPSIGRMDASLGCLLLGDGKGHFQEAQATGLCLQGQVRDAAVMQAKGQHTVVAARNNGSIWVGVWKR